MVSTSEAKSQLADSAGAGEALTLLRSIQGLMEKTLKVKRRPQRDTAEKQVSAAEFILEGLHAHKRIGRSEVARFSAGEKQPQPRKPEENRFRTTKMPYRSEETLLRYKLSAVSFSAISNELSRRLNRNLSCCRSDS